jgi:hypothetical protein
MRIISRFRALVHAASNRRSEATRPRPTVLSRPSQPVPRSVRVVNHSIAGRFAIAILRDWMPGDAKRCMLCRKCSAHNDSCLLVVTRDKPLDRGQGVLFSDAGLVWAPEGAKPPKGESSGLE